MSTVNGLDVLETYVIYQDIAFKGQIGKIALSFRFHGSSSWRSTIGKDEKVHFTLVDVKPAVMASLLRLGSTVKAGSLCHYKDFWVKMVILKNIPRVLSPELLSVIARMGHGDEIVLADANFPSASICKHGPEMVRADGHGIPVLLRALLYLLPLDSYVPAPVALMDPVPNDKAAGLQTPIWDEYRNIVNDAEGETVDVELVERFTFYERSKRAFAVVATGESALYGNIILKKGVL